MKELIELFVAAGIALGGISALAKYIIWRSRKDLEKAKELKNENN
jgi:hypothetical protein